MTHDEQCERHCNPEWRYCPCDRCLSRLKRLFAEVCGCADRALAAKDEEIERLKTDLEEEQQCALNVMAERNLAETARDDLQQQVAALREVAATLTALNVGNVQSESLLHKKLRAMMITYRAALARTKEKA